MADHFRQLSDVARTIDRRLPELTEAVQNRTQQFSAPKALRTLAELRREVDKLKVDVRAETQKSAEGLNWLNAIREQAASLVQTLKTDVSDSQHFLQQYGYEPVADPVPAKEPPVSPKNGAEGDNAEEDDKATSKVKPAETPKQTAPPQGQRRTPRLEDFGISESTMKMLKGAGKRAPEEKPAKPVQKKFPPQQAIPSPFQHNGFLCTPSLFPSSCDKEMSAGHASLASPLHIQSRDTDFSDPDTFEEPKSRLGFDMDSHESPKSPVLMTPGLKEMLTGDKRAGCLGNEGAGGDHHGVGMAKSKASVSLFPSMVEEKKSAYEYDEPEEPELTYSLEAIREMTGLYKFNPVISKPQPNSAPSKPQPNSATSKPQPNSATTFNTTSSISSTLLSNHYNKDLASSENKENTTPTEPELLSQRMAKVNKEAAAAGDTSVKPRTLYGEMPESPKTPKFMSDWKFTG